MGWYIRTSRKVNKAPLYIKEGPCGLDSYLYKCRQTRRWIVADRESDFSKGLGNIRSTREASLPSEDGLRWQYDGGSWWTDDPFLGCTADLDITARSDAVEHLMNTDFKAPLPPGTARTTVNFKTALDIVLPKANLVYLTEAHARKCASWSPESNTYMTEDAVLAFEEDYDLVLSAAWRRIVRTKKITAAYYCSNLNMETGEFEYTPVHSSFRVEGCEWYRYEHLARMTTNQAKALGYQILGHLADLGLI